MDEDVTKLTDEELQARIDGKEPEETEQEVAETPDDEKPSEEKTEEKPEPEKQEETEEPQKEEPEAKQPEEEQKPPSRRETLRIQQILAKRKEAQKPQPQQPSQPTNQDLLNYSDALDADPEVIRQLEEDRQRASSVQYNLGLQQAEEFSRAQNVASEFRTNIKLDYPLVKDKLDKLDPIDREAIDVEYLQMTGYDTETGLVQNPNIGYAEYVEARIEQAERLASRLNARTVKNVAKQAAQTGLRPDGSSAKSLNLNKAPEEMTNEELQAMVDRGLAGKL